MYSKKYLFNSVFNSTFSRPNLNVKSACSDQYLMKCLCTFRSIPTSEISDKITKVFSKLKVGQLLEFLSKRHQLRTKLKDQSSIIIRAWTRQCEYIVAQRFRRTQQMFSLYSRMWEERALKELLRRMQQQITRRGKDFMFGAIGITAFNWEANKISDDELSQHMKEFEYVNHLKQETIMCKKCKKRRLVDIMLPDMTYCKCVNTDVYTLDNWVPFLERKDLLVWRRPRTNGTYEYKMYGTYDDVTADDFLKVQVDTDFRQHWDTTAVNLFVVDSDEKSNSDVIYWEMLWPRMFSNRDYVYNRRYMVDEQSKIITIISKSVEHPSCPVKPDKHRVKNYESSMVIHSTTELDRHGIEFCLTYYDDPGVNIPAAVTSWVAIAGMPDFLNKLRKAAREYRQISYEFVDEDLPLNCELENEIPDDLRNLPMPSPSPSPAEDEPVPPVPATPESDSGGYWRYIHPYYYLG